MFWLVFLMSSGLVLPSTQHESVLACFAPFIQNYFMGASSQVLNIDLILSLSLLSQKSHGSPDSLHSHSFMFSSVRNVFMEGLLCQQWVWLWAVNGPMDQTTIQTLLSEYIFAFVGFTFYEVSTMNPMTTVQRVNSHRSITHHCNSKQLFIVYPMFWFYCTLIVKCSIFPFMYQHCFQQQQTPVLPR